MRALSRFFRDLSGLPSSRWSVCSWLLWSLVCLLVSPVWLVFLAVRRFRFVRFWRPLFRPSGAPRCGRWGCVPVGSVPALRASCFVWSVRPAVLLRRSGVVLWCWVFVSPAPPCARLPLP